MAEEYGVWEPRPRARPAYHQKWLGKVARSLGCALADPSWMFVVFFVVVMMD